MSEHQGKNRKYPQLWSIYEKGIQYRKQRRNNKAWCLFYKSVDLIDYMLLKNDDIELYELKYKMLITISEVQRIKYRLEPSSKTRGEAEEIRQKYLVNIISIEAKRQGIDGWYDAKNKILKYIDENEFDKAQKLGEELVEILGKLPYEEQTKKDRKILWQVYRVLYELCMFKDDDEKLIKYHEKIEDLSFIHGFDEELNFEN